MTWKKTVDNTYRWLGSKHFYVFVLAFFAFEAVWIAFSAVYPQAFDEDFHFGLTQFYSHYWLPFLSHQPASSYMYGEIPRSSSYLYHFLLSFPYRLIALVIHRQAYQVIALRLLNVALFGIGLTLFHRIVRKVCASARMANIVLFIFVLVPVVPLLAAQINYDNLLFPLVASVYLLAFKVIDQLKNQTISSATLISLLAICLLTSLVTYAFLPIFLGVMLYLAVVAYWAYRGQQSRFWLTLLSSFRRETILRKVLLILALLISVGLFTQRDGYNVVNYHKIEPNCSQVLSIQACSQYSVWEHDYVSHQAVVANPHVVSYNLFYYGAQWAYWMWYRSFFVINGPANSYTNYPPLPFPAAGSLIVILVSAWAIIKWRKKLVKSSPYTVFLLVISALYIAVLFADGYSIYRYTNVLELMNGRYLVPIILLLAALAGTAIGFSLRRLKTYKELVILGVVFLFINGGGFFTYITRSDDSWYWPNNAVKKVNHAAQKLTKPVIVKGRKTYGSSLWFFN